MAIFTSAAMLSLVAPVNMSFAESSDPNQQRCVDNLQRHIAAGGNHGSAAEHLLDSGICGSVPC